MKFFIRPLSAVGLAISLCVGSLLYEVPANAAERVVLKYKIFNRSIPVQDLSDLAETGEVSPTLRAYFRLTNRDPNDLRSALNREVPVNLIALDRILNSPIGNIAIDEVSKTIHTSSGEGDRQAMRSALILSATGDNRISLIEVIENYPTESVHVEGDRLVAAYEEIAALQRRIDQLMDSIGLF